MSDETEVCIESRIFRNYLSALRQAADDVRALRAELAAIGAIQMENGQWLYPFYLHGTERYLPREDWIKARKLIGEHIKAMQADD